MPCSPIARRGTPGTPATRLDFSSFESSVERREQSSHLSLSLTPHYPPAAANARGRAGGGGGGGVATTSLPQEQSHSPEPVLFARRALRSCSQRSVSQPVADDYHLKLRELQMRVDVFRTKGGRGRSVDELEEDLTMRERDLIYSVGLGKAMLDDLKEAKAELEHVRHQRRCEHTDAKHLHTELTHQRTAALYAISDNDDLLRNLTEAEALQERLQEENTRLSYLESERTNNEWIAEANTRAHADLARREAAVKAAEEKAAATEAFATHLLALSEVGGEASNLQAKIDLLVEAATATPPPPAATTPLSPSAAGDGDALRRLHESYAALRLKAEADAADAARKLDASQREREAACAALLSDLTAALRRAAAAEQALLESQEEVLAAEEAADAVTAQAREVAAAALRHAESLMPCADVLRGPAEAQLVRAAAGQDGAAGAAGFGESLQAVLAALAESTRCASRYVCRFGGAVEEVWAALSDDKTPSPHPPATPDSSLARLADLKLLASVKAAELDKLGVARKTLEGSLAHASSELRGAEERCAALEATLLARGVESEGLRGKAALAARLQGSHAKLQSEAARLAAAKKRLEAELEACRRQAKAEARRKTAAESALADDQAELAELRRELVRLTKKKEGGGGVGSGSAGARGVRTLKAARTQAALLRDMALVREENLRLRGVTAVAADAAAEAGAAVQQCRTISPCRKSAAGNTSGASLDLDGLAAGGVVCGQSCVAARSEGSDTCDDIDIILDMDDSSGGRAASDHAAACRTRLVSAYVAWLTFVVRRRHTTAAAAAAASPVADGTFSPSRQEADELRREIAVLSARLERRGDRLPSALPSAAALAAATAVTVTATPAAPLSPASSEAAAATPEPKLATEVPPASQRCVMLMHGGVSAAAAALVHRETDFHVAEQPEAATAAVRPAGGGCALDDSTTTQCPPAAETSLVSVSCAPRTPKRMLRFPDGGGRATPTPRVKQHSSVHSARGAHKGVQVCIDDTCCGSHTCGLLRAERDAAAAEAAGLAEQYAEAAADREALEALNGLLRANIEVNCLQEAERATENREAEAKAKAGVEERMKEQLTQVLQESITLQSQLKRELEGKTLILDQMSALCSEKDDLASHNEALRAEVSVVKEVLVGKNQHVAAVDLLLKEKNADIVRLHADAAAAAALRRENAEGREKIEVLADTLDVLKRHNEEMTEVVRLQAVSGDDKHAAAVVVSAQPLLLLEEEARRAAVLVLEARCAHALDHAFRTQLAAALRAEAAAAAAAHVSAAEREEDAERRVLRGSEAEQRGRLLLLHAKRARQEALLRLRGEIDELRRRGRDAQAAGEEQEALLGQQRRELAGSAELLRASELRHAADLATAARADEENRQLVALLHEHSGVAKASLGSARRERDELGRRAAARQAAYACACLFQETLLACADVAAEEQAARDALAGACHAGAAAWRALAASAHVGRAAVERDEAAARADAVLARAAAAEAARLCGVRQSEALTADILRLAGTVSELAAEKDKMLAQAEDSAAAERGTLQAALGQEQTRVRAAGLRAKEQALELGELEALLQEREGEVEGLRVRLTSAAAAVRDCAASQAAVCDAAAEKRAHLTARLRAAEDAEAARARELAELRLAAAQEAAGAADAREDAAVLAARLEAVAAAAAAAAALTLAAEEAAARATLERQACEALLLPQAAAARDALLAAAAAARRGRGRDEAAAAAAVRALEAERERAHLGVLHASAEAAAALQQERGAALRSAIEARAAAAEAALQERCVRLQEANEELSQRLETVEEESMSVMLDLSTRIAEATTYIRRLEDEKRNQVSELADNVDRLTTKLGSVRRERDSLSQSVASATAAADALERQGETAACEVTVLRARCVALEASVLELTDARGTLAAQAEAAACAAAAALEAERSAARTELDAQAAAHEAATATGASRLEAARAKASAAEAACGELRSEVGSAAAAAATRAAALEEEAVAQAARLRAEVAALEEEVAAAASERERLRAAASAADARAGAAEAAARCARERLESAGTRAAAAEAARAEAAAALTARVGELEAQLFCAGCERDAAADGLATLRAEAAAGRGVALAEAACAVERGAVAVEEAEARAAAVERLCGSLCEAAARSAGELDAALRLVQELRDRLYDEKACHAAAAAAARAEAAARGAAAALNAAEAEARAAVAAGAAVDLATLAAEAASARAAAEVQPSARRVAGMAEQHRVAMRALQQEKDALQASKVQVLAQVSELKATIRQSEASAATATAAAATHAATEVEELRREATRLGRACSALEAERAEVCARAARAEGSSRRAEELEGTAGTLLAENRELSIALDHSQSEERRLKGRVEVLQSKALHMQEKYDLLFQQVGVKDERSQRMLEQVKLQLESEVQRQSIQVQSLSERLTVPKAP